MSPELELEKHKDFRPVQKEPRLLFSNRPPGRSPKQGRPLESVVFKEAKEITEQPQIYLFIY